MRGLYVHLPFCHQKCHYCNFVISTRYSKDEKKKFFSSLSNEILHARQKYGSLFFDTIYLGGGTPSILENAEFSNLIDEIYLNFKFPIGFEFTCEANPKDVTREKAKVWRELGINRISLGAQAFQDSILKELGRDHDASDIRNSVDILRSAGFQNISLDLICRLPSQRPEDFEESVRRALELAPQQITIYDLEVHDKTVFGHRQRKGELLLPREDNHLAMLERAEAILERSELKRYEIANFAIPGFESKHNLIYWHNEEYLGLGPGAFSYLNGERYQLAHDVSSYMRKCGQKDFSTHEHDLIDDQKKEIETLLTGIRLTEGIELNSFRLIRERLQTNLGSLIEECLIISENGRIYLSARGRRVYENLIARLVEF